MSTDMVFEEVPRLMRRTGDSYLSGQNNSSILLGRDRLGSVDSGYGSVDSVGGGVGAGAIHLSVGRSREDPSVLEDRATLYLSAKTDPDTAADTAAIGNESIAKSGAILRGDCVRISARIDLKVSVGRAYLIIGSDGTIVIEGDVSLGQDAAERIIRGDAFSRFWNTVTVPTPMGPSGPPPPIPESIFSPRNKVK